MAMRCRIRLVLGLGLGLLVCGCAAAVSPPASQPKIAPPAAPLFKRGLSFGTADPYTLLGFDPEAQWVALCQAREDTDGDGITRVGFFHHGEPSGDVMKTYFVLDGGEGEVVDGYLGRAASGAWVALRKGQRVYLLNTRTGAERNLTQIELDKEADPSPAGRMRMLGFSPTKEQLLLVQETKAGRAGVALMDLATGELRQIDLGAGRVWQAAFSEDGSWIQAALVTADRNGNGSLDLPTIATTLRGDSCSQPAAYSSWGLQKDHDEVTPVMVPVAGGKVRPATGVQGFLDGDAVLRRDDGTLVRETAAGAQQRLAGSKCEGAVLDHYSLAHQRWLVACLPNAPGELGVATKTRELPSFGELKKPISGTEMRVFGQGLPLDGRPIGVTLMYGAEPGEFGTERHARLDTDDGTLLFDLKELVIAKVPQGYDLCARHDATFLLEPQRSPWRDQEQGSRANAAVALWSPGGALTPIIAADRCADLPGDRQALVGSWIFDWQAKKVIGTVERLCPEGDCRRLRDSSYSSAQGFLLNRPAPARSAAALERSLRESLGASGPSNYAENGPLSFQSWLEPEAAGGPKPTPTHGSQMDDSREPTPSCEPVVGDVKGTPSALPSWTELGPLAGTVAQFPRPGYANDDQPTYEYLQQRICAVQDLSFAFAGVEQALVRASKLPNPKEIVDPQVLPATQGLKGLLWQCRPADTCRHAIALADSRYEQLKHALAAELLVTCDAKTIGNRFEQLQAQPLLLLEWLIAGEGRKASSAAMLKPLLEQTLASKDEDDIQRAILLTASDNRRQSSQLLLETRARVLKQPVPVVTEMPGGKAESTLGVEDFDLLLGPATDPRLKKLHGAACGRVGHASTENWLARRRCQDAKAGRRPMGLEPRFLDAPRPDTRIRVMTLTELLGAGAQQACASALSGACPALPIVELRKKQGHLWSVLYRAGLALAQLPGSPLAGGVLDVPLRMADSKLQASWRMWLDGQLYELGPRSMAQASLAWANEQKTPVAPDALAIRGLLAWLNGIASERASNQRFYLVSQGIDAYLLMATREQACALSKANALLLTQEPSWFEPRF